MFQSGGQSDAKLPVLSSEAGPHFEFNSMTSPSMMRSDPPENSNNERDLNLNQHEEEVEWQALEKIL
ncbi:hypothetical protein TNCV_1530841 [Trichonephila clavipes]|nr:hypothetical protein TNCV_1530841 [Trichonephila clavipes]